ncbi:MAG: undecaprenyl-phosphate 4-deoxy-4-formamido-L-arabinose transferase [Burkholderiales bacterium]|nr:undecaprenyl-phosphate 4-deoxy-4-formamido-L-arabinose transferase [Burkholderiales bacterium]
MLDFDPIQTVSVVIPVFNEEESLPALLERTQAACAKLKQDYEIILVDDGSSDASATLITAAAEAADSHVLAILLNRNYGQHAAIMAGFKSARGDLVVTLDADLQNPPEEIPNLVEAAEQGHDVVGTIRTNRQDSLFRRIASKLINAVIRKATGRSMSDYGCMLRAYRRPIIEAMLCCHERSTFIPILANMFARRVIEVPVQHEERKFGTSKYGLMQLINLMYDLVTCLTTTPLRILSIFGSALALSGFVLALLLIVLRFLLGADWGAEGVFMLFSLLFIFIGAQFVGMGLLGEYIGRIYQDVRARPRYLIQKVVGQRRFSNKHKDHV